MKNIALTETSYLDWQLRRPIRCCIVLLGGLLLASIFCFIVRIIGAPFPLLGLNMLGIIIVFILRFCIVTIWFRLHGPIWKEVLGIGRLQYPLICK